MAGVIRLQQATSAASWLVYVLHSKLQSVFTCMRHDKDNLGHSEADQPRRCRLLLSPHAKEGSPYEAGMDRIDDNLHSKENAIDDFALHASYASGLRDLAHIQSFSEALIYSMIRWMCIAFTFARRVQAQIHLC